MRKDIKPPKNIEVNVKNPRYEGATPGMVARALLRRPKKVDQESEGEPGTDAPPEGAHSST